MANQAKHNKNSVAETRYVVLNELPKDAVSKGLTSCQHIVNNARSLQASVDTGGLVCWVPRHKGFAHFPGRCDQRPGSVSRQWCACTGHRGTPAALAGSHPGSLVCILSMELSGTSHVCTGQRAPACMPSAPGSPSPCMCAAAFSMLCFDAHMSTHQAWASAADPGRA